MFLVVTVISRSVSLPVSKARMLNYFLSRMMLWNPWLWDSPTSVTCVLNVREIISGESEWLRRNVTAASPHPISYLGALLIVVLHGTMISRVDGSWRSKFASSQSEDLFIVGGKGYRLVTRSGHQVGFIWAIAEPSTIVVERYSETS